jgi:hypothetical protein
MQIARIPRSPVEDLHGCINSDGDELLDHR